MLHLQMAAPADFATRAAALSERATAEHATTWRANDPAQGHPNPLVGVLVRVEEGHTSYGPARIVVLRAPDEAEWGVWLLTKVLREEFAKLRPVAGELVAVSYLGTVPAREGRAQYERYRVVVDREEAGTDWDALAAVDEPVAASPEVARCEACGVADPEHAPGCPHELPF